MTTSTLSPPRRTTLAGDCPRASVRQLPDRRPISRVARHQGRQPGTKNGVTLTSDFRRRIGRWWWRGALLAIPFGYIAILFLNDAFQIKDEFAGDWPNFGLIAMPFFCIGVLGIRWLGWCYVGIWRDCRRR